MDTKTFPAEAPGLIDPFGRHIIYLRLSLTDRCDLRCTYCMAAKPDFLPKSEVLMIEELGEVADAFIARGIRKIRLTGGEPLVRRGFMSLVRGLSTHLEAGRLDEVTLTTNGTQLARFAGPLAEAGVRRVNVSLDTLDADSYSTLTRGGDVTKALDGIKAAQDAGLRVKINAVALAGVNERELPEMITWAHGEGMDITLIEVMPLGEIGADRGGQFLSLERVKERLAERWTLAQSDHTSGGPARYVDIAETGGRLGLITPLSENFCAGCNRVRVTCTGQLYMCLGRMGKVDLREPLRTGGAEALDAALEEAISLKPEAHDFDVGRGAPLEVTRSMSTTGG